MPSSWQGWVMLAAFAILTAFGVFIFPPNDGPGAFFVYVAVLIGLLTAICWLKGEPPRWRWGKD